MNRRKTKLGAAAGTLAAAIGVTFTAWTFAQAATTLPSGNENTSIIVQNVGNAPADFIVDYYLPNGTRLDDASDTQFGVPTGGTRVFAQAINSELGAGYRGVGVVSSDQPINALLVRDILANTPTNNHSYSLVSAQASGGAKLALPIMFDEYSAQWNSRASVVNTGTETACLKISYFVTATLGATPVGQVITDNPTGQSGCANGYSLPAGGQLTFGRSGTGTTQYPQALRSTQSAAQIEVVNANANNQIAASVDIFRSDGNRLLGSYNGFIVNDAQPATDDVGTDVVVPLTIKSTSGYYTVIGVQNIDGVAANVNIRYIGTANGAPVDMTVTLQNVTNAGFHSTYETVGGQDIPVGFVGYARITSTARIAALLVRGKQTAYASGVQEPIYTAANAVPADQAGGAWNLPLIFRRYAQNRAGAIGYNSWIQVQVADGSTASVTLRFVGDPNSNCPVGPYETTVNVSGSKVFYMNSDSDNGFPNNGANSPSCFWGGAQVTSNKPVIVIANVSSDSYIGGDNEGLYNAFED